VTAFLASTDPQKRAKLSTSFCRPRFGKSLAESWVIHMIPRESNNRLLNQKSRSNNGWAEHFNKNTPLDKVVYELVTATGDIDKNPAGIYFVANPSVDKITDKRHAHVPRRATANAPSCHNHPFTDWKQTSTGAMASFFMKTRVQGTAKGPPREAPPPSVAESTRRSTRRAPCPNPPRSSPKFLQGEQPKINTLEMRPTLAKWMTARQQVLRPRHGQPLLVSALWPRLVNPVDDMHDDNAATHPQLLATLTEQFKLHGFDIKYLVRAICNSEAYQRSSVSASDVAAIDPDLYTRREIRVMAPEQMYDSLTVILGAAGGKGEPKDKAGKKGPPRRATASSTSSASRMPTRSNIRTASRKLCA